MFDKFTRAIRILVKRKLDIKVQERPRRNRLGPYYAELKIRVRARASAQHAAADIEDSEPNPEPEPMPLKYRVDPYSEDENPDSPLLNWQI